MQSADDLRRENEALRRRIARTEADLDAARPAYIFTERGVGYRMAAPGDPADDR